MPELPEVETIARGLATRVSGDVIESVWLGQKPEPLKSPAHEIAAALEHARILTVRRVGKHIVFDLEPSNVARAPSPAKSRHPKPVHKESKARLPRLSRTLNAMADEGVRPTSASSQWIVHLGMTGRLQV